MTIRAFLLPLRNARSFFYICLLVSPLSVCTAHEVMAHTLVQQSNLLNTAISAGLAAGAYLQRSYYEQQAITAETKINRFDLVTQFDKNAHRLLVDQIKERFPNHAIFSEEGQRDQQGEVVWCLDPLDGTMNFKHHHPDFTISIAALRKGQVDCAVIVHPYTMDVYYALRGKGAWLNGRRLHVSPVKTLAESLVSTEFPFVDRAHEAQNTYWPVYRHLRQTAHNVLTGGSTALELAYVAAGRLDAYININHEVGPWDIAAGVLLVAEAGGTIVDQQGVALTNPLTADTVIATQAASVNQEVLQILQHHGY